MRLTAPRLEPLGEDAIAPDLAEALKARAAAGGVLNIYRTLAHDPATLSAFLAWGGHILSDANGLSPRLREIVILRTGYLCRSGYEWVQHARMGARAGVTPDELEAIKLGPDAPLWTEAERALLRATDELHADQFISTPAWQALTAHFTTQQVLIAILAAGQYTTVSMVLNALGVQLDEGQTLDPDLADYEAAEEA